MSRILMVAAAMTVVSAPAFAQGMYADVGYQYISIDEDGAEADLGAVTGHVGYNFSEWFALEAEGGIGVQDETFNVLGTDVDISLNHIVGAYARANVPLGQRAGLFARVGAVNAEVEVSGGGFSDSGSDSGVGYGAGGEFMFTPTFGIRGEYTRYDIEDLEADTATVAAVFKF